MSSIFFVLFTLGSSSKHLGNKRDHNHTHTHSEKKIFWPYTWRIKKGEGGTLPKIGQQEEQTKSNDLST